MRLLLECLSPEADEMSCVLEMPFRRSSLVLLRLYGDFLLWPYESSLLLAEVSDRRATGFNN